MTHAIFRICLVRFSVANCESVSARAERALLHVQIF